MIDIEQKTFYVLDYGDVDSLLEELYGEPFSIVADMELCNYQSKEIEVRRDFYKEEYEERGWEGAGQGLYKLAKDGKIPEGWYLIRIYW